MSSRTITEAGFLAFVLVLALIELVARRPGSRVPRLAVAVSRLMRTRSGRVGVIAGWAWLGLHFFAR